MNDFIADLLSTDGYIAVNKRLIKLLGLHEAIIIGELCSEYNYYKHSKQLDETGSFYSTRENIEENTGLNDYHQRNAINTLIEKNILSVIKKGLPAVNYYLINFEQLSNLLSTSALTSERLDVEPVKINNNKETNINKKISNNKLLDITAPEKPKKKNLYTKCLDYITQYTNNIPLQDALYRFLDLRLEIAKKEGRPFYYNMWPSIVNELDKLAKDSDTAIKIVEQSITKGWKGFYALKTYNNQTIKSADYENDVHTTKSRSLNISNKEY